MKQIFLVNRTGAVVATATCDDEDWPLVAGHKWTLLVVRHGHGEPHRYARARINGRDWMMHRRILSPAKGEQVDHRDHNGLNNCRSNIRKCTHSQNMMNRRSCRNMNGGIRRPLKNIEYRPERPQAYRVVVRAGGVRVVDKSFSDPDEAIAFRDKTIALHHGEFAIQE